ncbi:MAG: VanZ family protein [Opitutaceae bacterium]
MWPLLFAGLIFLASGQSRTVGPPSIPFFDKFVHFSIYGLFATLLVRVVFHRTRRWRGALAVIALVSLYGVSDEFHQSFTPGRSVELADWMADTLGAGVAAISYCFWPAYRRALETRATWPMRKRERGGSRAPAAPEAEPAVSGGAGK